MKFHIKIVAVNKVIKTILIEFVSNAAHRIIEVYQIKLLLLINFCDWLRIPWKQQNEA